MPFYESPLETHQSSFLPIDLERAIFNLFDYRSVVKLILNNILLSSLFSNLNVLLFVSRKRRIDLI